MFGTSVSYEPPILFSSLVKSELRWLRLEIVKFEAKKKRRKGILLHKRDGDGFLTCKDFRRMCDHSFPACNFFYYWRLLLISLRTLIPLSMPRPVHSGSASWGCINTNTITTLNLKIETCAHFLRFQTKLCLRLGSPSNKKVIIFLAVISGLQSVVMNEEMSCSGGSFRRNILAFLYCFI